MVWVHKRNMHLKWYFYTTNGLGVGTWSDLQTKKAIQIPDIKSDIRIVVFGHPLYFTSSNQRVYLIRVQGRDSDCEDCGDREGSGSGSRSRSPIYRSSPSRSPGLPSPPGPPVSLKTAGIYIRPKFSWLICWSTFNYIILSTINNDVCLLPVNLFVVL